MRQRGYFSKMGEKGFSLVEVIVVVAIMAVLGTVLAPQFFRYVNQNRATACRVDRESILAVYERCIYEETKSLDPSDLQKIIDADISLDVTTRNEVLQLGKCPLGGHYTGVIVGDTAMITCDCAGHEEVVADFAAWDGIDLAEGIDEPFTETPPPSTPEPDEPSSEEPSTEEEPEDSGVWPYQTDGRWDGKRYPGQSVEIDVPVKFTTKEGNTYVVTDRNKTGKFSIKWEWSRGPEVIDVRNDEGIISCSGIKITDISKVLYKNIDPTDTSGMITGIHYGDIIVVDGKEYIYGTLSESLQIPVPTPENPGNFFYVGEDKTRK